MPQYTLQEINRIVGGTLQGDAQLIVSLLAYDSRRLPQPAGSLFFALHTAHADGHRFVQDAYKKGVKAFVVSKPLQLAGASFVVVPDTLQALQTLAAHHRRQFNVPVIGITGSNGKTVVKEWLYSLLEADEKIVRSPKSFNSQLGVPLSVWQLEATHTLGIFEAGISHPGEMAMLHTMVRPTIGVLTNLGEAHSEGFSSNEEKLAEKLKLFTGAAVVIGPHELIGHLRQPLFTWSKNEGATLHITGIHQQAGSTLIHAVYKGESRSLQIPFSDDASVQNAITCWCVLLYLGKTQTVIQQRFSSLHPIDMRLQLVHGINHCLLINDSYSADPTSLRIALDFMAQQSAGLSRTVILSAFAESGKDLASLHREIAGLLQQYGVQRVVAIGPALAEGLQSLLTGTAIESYGSTEEFIAGFRSSSFHQQIILLKGARKAGFERIAALFEQKLHGTVLQINLDALTHNLKQYRRLLQPSTKMMAMVKAFSYGSGGAEIASVLQFNHVAYLGVAYADEGVELVKAGITLPVMVMNAEPSSFAVMVEHGLQPVVYSASLLQAFESYVKQQGLAPYPVHLEIETGMNRLGFALDEVPALARHLQQSSLTVASVFSHLAASEEAANDGFTQTQAALFGEAVALLTAALHYPFLRHLANSAAIVRHPHLQFDMVRLGIGLYGVAPDAEERLALQPVATLRSTVAQVKEVKKGESISYNRRGIVQRDSRIATVRIGYADGYSRRFGNGVGRMMVRGMAAPVVGTVCMDMTMLDVTDIAGVAEGDDVVVFGPGLPVQEVAAMIKTIPYEIMTAVSQRVKRVYYHE